MSRHVDLHLHLLPGVDDGPPTIEASLDHARRMVAGGVHEAVVTPHVGHPHFELDLREIPERTRALQAALDAEELPLTVHAGAELHPSRAASLTREELAVVAQGPAGGRWVLLEVPFAGIDAEFAEACASIRAHGFGLLIAHPERARGLLAGDGIRQIRAEVARGAVLQVNVCSLLGAHGAEAQTTARRLLRAGLAYVLASDGHGGSRGHTLAAGPMLAQAAGASRVQSWQLTEANPRFLLTHGIPAPVGPDDRLPWRSPRARRIAEAMAAARSRR